MLKAAIATASLFLILAGCRHKAEQVVPAKQNILRDQACRVAEAYLSDRLINSVRKVTPAGSIIFSDEHAGFVIEAGTICSGDINSDKNDDVLITILSMKGGIITEAEILILLGSKEGGLSLARAIKSDMKILGIKDGIITAKVPTHPRSSPLFNCESCQEIIKYRFAGGNLEKIE